MLSNSIATFVRVTPSPRTIAESSAVFRKLKEYGQVTSFIKGPHYLERAHSQLYYAVLANTSPTLNPPLKFDVPVYHGLQDPKDEDPYNIRGLQDRKPYPEPIKFACTVEQIDDLERRKQVEDYLRLKNPYREEFRTAWEADDDTQTVLRETKAPLPLLRGLGRLVPVHKGREMSRLAAEKLRRRRMGRPTILETSKVGERMGRQDLDIREPTIEPDLTKSSAIAIDDQVSEVRVRRVNSITSSGLPKKLLKRSRSDRSG